eukprot:CAMPEP_0116890534 /NCGR_PEP_ID=MMETSP0467-20121206/1058_1 /TAXON_ID=283647 /ORGANISM="Mesodinium pulex, Strain SPMC105" /LENGTH=89 /DNA_ID=CAMNT_0004558361 /DNA_START=1075 /DNA_END=1344 /DNA_ORIENTATION=-
MVMNMTVLGLNLRNRTMPRTQATNWPNSKVELMLLSSSEVKPMQEWQSARRLYFWMAGKKPVTLKSIHYKKIKNLANMYTSEFTSSNSE